MGYKYGQTSRQRLSTCHVDIQKIFKVAIHYVDISILCGHRPEEEQDIAFRAGTTEVMFPDSKHNSMPSMAVDASPNPIDWNDAKRFAVMTGRLFQIVDDLYDQGVITHKLRWGGDWDKD